MCSLFIFAFIGVTQFISLSAQQFPPGRDAVPEPCRRPPPVVEKPLECCPIQSLFPENDYKECNFIKYGSDKAPPIAPPNCGKYNCIAKRYNLTKSDGTIDSAAASGYLDKWVEDTSDPGSFAEVLKEAKKICLGNVQPPPSVPGNCPSARFIMCTSSLLFMKCPAAKWSNIDTCNDLGEYFAQCSDFLIKHF